MTHRGYALTPVTRHLPLGQMVECIEITGNGRQTWAESMAIAKRAVESWESARKRKENGNGLA